MACDDDHCMYALPAAYNNKPGTQCNIQHSKKNLADWQCCEQTFKLYSTDACMVINTLAFSEMLQQNYHVFLIIPDKYKSKYFQFYSEQLVHVHVYIILL